MTWGWIFRMTRRCLRLQGRVRRKALLNEQIARRGACRGAWVERQGLSALLLSSESFDVRTATPFPESRAGRGPCSDTGHGAQQRVHHQKGDAGLAAAAVAVCAGAVLRVPGRAGDGAAVVDADLGPEYVYPGAAPAGSGAV